MKTIINGLVMSVLATLMLTGCTPRSKYEQKLKNELARGVRCDSLFMGVYLGMPVKEFYSHCWDLNKKGKIKQGKTNTSVEYQLKTELKFPATMDFYPTFVEGKISEMPVRFAYNGWAPWNKKLSSENLEQDVLQWYEKVYGKGFMKIKHPEKGIAYVKIDGNRRISIFKEDDLFVWAVFTDMLTKKELTDSKSIINTHIDIKKDTIR